MSEGRGTENAEAVGGCGHHGVNPQLSPGASPSSRGLRGRKSLREWRKGDSIVRLRPLGRDYGGVMGRREWGEIQSGPRARTGPALR